MRILARVLASYALGSISSAHKAPTPLVPSRPPSAQRLVSMETGARRDFLCTHAHFRLEPEAPCLTAGTSAWGLLESLCGRPAAAARVVDWAPDLRCGDADPAFDLSQDADFLTVAIRVPYARVSEFDVYFEGVDFKFYAKPYFLRRVLGVWL